MRYHTSQHNAFTMMELIFVIVVLGILSAVALPKFADNGKNAHIAVAKSDVSSIRSAIISERQTRLIQGDNSWVSGLSSGTTTLFTGPDATHKLLMYGIKSGTTDGHWRTTDTQAPFKNYKFKIGSVDCAFAYDSSTGKFSLTTTGQADCDKIVK